MNHPYPWHPMGMSLPDGYMEALRKITGAPPYPSGVAHFATQYCAQGRLVIGIPPEPGNTKFKLLEYCKKEKKFKDHNCTGYNDEEDDSTPDIKVLSDSDLTESSDTESSEAQSYQKYISDLPTVKTHYCSHNKALVLGIRTHEDYCNFHLHESKLLPLNCRCVSCKGTVAGANLDPQGAQYSEDLKAPVIHVLNRVTLVFEQYIFDPTTRGLKQVYLENLRYRAAPLESHCLLRHSDDSMDIIIMKVGTSLCMEQWEPVLKKYQRVLIPVETLRDQKMKRDTEKLERTRSRKRQQPGTSTVVLAEENAKAKKLDAMEETIDALDSGTTFSDKGTATSRGPIQTDNSKLAYLLDKLTPTPTGRDPSTSSDPTHPTVSNLDPLEAQPHSSSLASLGPLPGSNSASDILSTFTQLAKLLSCPSTSNGILEGLNQIDINQLLSQCTPQNNAWLAAYLAGSQVGATGEIPPEMRIPVPAISPVLEAFLAKANIPNYLVVDPALRDTEASKILAETMEKQKAKLGAEKLARSAFNDAKRIANLPPTSSGLQTTAFSTPPPPVLKKMPVDPCLFPYITEAGTFQMPPLDLTSPESSLLYLKLAKALRGTGLKVDTTQFTKSLLKDTDSRNSGSQTYTAEPDLYIEENVHSGHSSNQDEDIVFLSSKPPATKPHKSRTSRVPRTVTTASQRPLFMVSSNPSVTAQCRPQAPHTPILPTREQLELLGNKSNWAIVYVPRPTAQKSTVVEATSSANGSTVVAAKPRSPKNPDKNSDISNSLEAAKIDEDVGSDSDVTFSFSSTPEHRN